MADLILVDDEPNLRKLLTRSLQRAGHEVREAGTLAQARELWHHHPAGAVITDLRLPDGEGLELLNIVPADQMILMTAYASPEILNRAYEVGCRACLIKPLDPGSLLSALDQIESSGGDIPQETVDDSDRFGPLIGRSPAMRGLFNAMVPAARGQTALLITGPTGSGKELVAQTLHAISPRNKGPFIPINCGAIPSELVESELFGHMRGAFSGADRDRPGLVAAAEGGTLFLDEIGDLPLPAQVKMLRLLQERTIRPVGGTKDRLVDVRMIAATHRNLGELVRQGRFREDLFFRLNVIELHLPPLSERRDDIPLLVHHILQKIRDRGGPDRIASPELMAQLQNRPWPGNVRELENTLERLAAMTPGRLIPPMGEGLDPVQAGELGLPPLKEEGMDLEKLLDRIEYHYLSEALKITGGHKQNAAALLGLTFRSFRYRLKKFEDQD